MWPNDDTVVCDSLSFVITLHRYLLSGSSCGNAFIWEVWDSLLTYNHFSIYVHDTHEDVYAPPLRQHNSEHDFKCYLSHYQMLKACMTSNIITCTKLSICELANCTLCHIFWKFILTKVSIEQEKWACSWTWLQHLMWVHVCIYFSVLTSLWCILLGLSGASPNGIMILIRASVSEPGLELSISYISGVCHSICFWSCNLRRAFKIGSWSVSITVSCVDRLNAEGSRESASQ